MHNDDQFYLSKFELDPENDIFMDSMDAAAFFGSDDNMVLDDNYLDELDSDIWEV